ncbi:MAG: purine-binding chemotaxis protein CheW [Gemmatimonadetes bacterium]|jgi:purine-binding chemotaxis protein CheW|nr:purine-binding chemotaxis protein CheW [Gemmatimonadota bacterium]
MDDKRESMEKTLEEREELELGVEFEEESIQFVIVTLAEQWCAFYGSAVTSIATVETITPIPGTPDYLLGVMYYQGRVESVLDIKSILGIRDSAITGKSRVAITLSGEVQSGILVDTVEDVVDLPERKIFAPLHTMEQAKKEFVTGEIEYRERNVVILDLAKIFERVLKQEDRGA